MSDRAIFEQLEALGINRDRLASVMKQKDNWGDMVNAFEYLTVLGTVLDAWPR